ncbi:MAG: aspartyl protease family protein [Ignavibacteria bacterium]|nr:aspartyl protease family protein [Ignavibacteria bacterium]
MRIIIVSLLVLLSFKTMAQNNFKNLNDLYEKKEFFKFSRDIKTSGLGSWQNDYVHALFYNLVSNTAGSDSLIDLLMKMEIQDLNDSLKLTLLEASLHNAVNSYDYKKADNITNEILDKYASIYDSTELAETKNSQLIWQAASLLSPQTCEFKSNSEIKTSRDMAGLMNIPVTMNKISTDFIFDTGANFSVVTKSYAEKLKMIFLKGKIKVGSVTGGKVDSELAYAEEMLIGNMIFKNVLFLVLPDESLSFAGGLYTIDGIIGLPVIREMKEVHIMDNAVYVPKIAEKKEINNLVMDGFIPVINVVTGNDTLPFTFDTGARSTLLYKPYFEKFKADVTAKYKQEEIEVGGAGGTKKVKGYKLNNISLNIAGSTAILDEVSLIKEIMLDNSKYFYGNLGQDYMKQFDVMILNFESMYAEFKRK